MLTRFRQHQFAVSADIEYLFFHVGVPPRNQPPLRFLWLEDGTSHVKVLQFIRHIFGARDSPMCAIFALQQTARDNVEIFSESSRAVLSRYYMDDYLISIENRNDTMRISKDLVNLLKM